MTSKTSWKSESYFFLNKILNRLVKMIGGINVHGVTSFADQDLEIGYGLFGKWKERCKLLIKLTHNQ